MSNQDVEMWKAINEAKAVIEEMRRVEAEQEEERRIEYENLQETLAQSWQMVISKRLPTWAHHRITLQQPLYKYDCLATVNLPIGDVKVEVNSIGPRHVWESENTIVSFSILLDGKWKQVKDFGTAVGYLAESYGNNKTV